MKKLLTLYTLLCLVISTSAQAASMRQQAEDTMRELELLIKKAEKKKIPTLKERTALRTAEIFMDYADWDEANLEANTKHFSLVARYKDEPEKWAALLPDFEREEIVKMMNSSIQELNAIMAGTIRRLPTPEVDWHRTQIDGDAILFEGQPVFLNDWTWKPRIDNYTQYHGNQDGFFLTPSYVINKRGDINPKVIKELKAKKDGSMGFVFMNHSSFPAWAKKKDPRVTDGPGIKYTMYDINNPLARQVQRNLIGATVPHMAGKQYTQLGYMLCNEPHWNTIEKTWASAPISDLAYEAFKQWLKNKHGNIATLNTLWGKNYASFDHIDCPKIMRDELQGTPMYFDFMAFNMDRVTDWFRFLRDEIKTHDPAARTHIKIMPTLWTDNKRDSGIDMEALTYNSDIIGNDASSCGAWMWGKPKHWEKYYSFDWIELCMGQDFFKSVSPEKIMYNTEGHFLTTGKYRDLYQTTDYTRLNYWMAYVHGLTAQQTWYWCRREDGSSRPSEDSNGYAGSNNHQPRVVNEVHATIADLNSVSDYIMAMQRQRKNLRVFYTKASSINKTNHMDHVFDTYESIFFEGQPVGFATAGIINHQDNKLWEAIIIAQTPYVFESDMQALQAYLNTGGTIIVDNASLKTDEYGRTLTTQLKASKGKIIRVNSLQELASEALAIAQTSPQAPQLCINETNPLKKKTCVWREIDGKKKTRILNVANFGKKATKIEITNRDGSPVQSVINVLTGQIMSATIELPVHGLYLLEVVK